MILEFRQLTHLLAVAEKGTIGKAAESLGISQPALTKSIKTLEAALGVKLLERRSRGVVPTAYGDLVIAHGRHVRLHVSNVEEGIRSRRAGIGGVIKVGFGQGEAHRLMPLSTMRVLSDHPNVQFSVVTASVEQLADYLVDGEIEFAVTPFGTKSYGSQIVEEYLFDDRPVVVVRPGHPLTKHSCLQPRQLVDCKWILTSVELPVRRTFDQMFVAANLTPPAPTIQSDSAVYTKMVLRETDFAAFFPRDEIIVEEEARLLVGIPVETSVPPRTVGILRRRSEPLSPLGQLLVGAIKEVCRAFGYLDRTNNKHSLDGASR